VPPWTPRRDLSSYVLGGLILLFELPLLAVLAVGTLITRPLAALARRRRSRTRGVRRNEPSDWN
jgi:hypothetical protein